MAKIDLKFLDVDELDLTTIQVYKHPEMDGIIAIYSATNDEVDESVCIHLDKSTAIKFAKTLRTEINKIES